MRGFARAKGRGVKVAKIAALLGAALDRARSDGYAGVMDVAALNAITAADTLRALVRE